MIPNSTRKQTAGVRQRQAGSRKVTNGCERVTGGCWRVFRESYFSEPLAAMPRAHTHTSVGGHESPPGHEDHMNWGRG